MEPPPELQEELGITAKESDLVYCGDLTIFWDDVFFGEPYHDRQYSKVYLLWADVEESGFTLQEEEVDGVLWINLEECIARVADGTLEHCIIPEELRMIQAAAES